MVNTFIGGIVGFGGNFNPRGWAFCDGQLLSIAQNTALFSILGTTYGGDGRTTFGLPDLRGRLPIHTGGSQGQGSGLSAYRLGQRGGIEEMYLNWMHMPSHTHTLTRTTAFNTTVKVADEDGAIAAAFKGVLGKRAIEDSRGQAVEVYVNKNSASFTEDNTIGGVDITQPRITLGYNGNNIGFGIMQPYLCVNYIIALVGVFPSRS